MPVACRASSCSSVVGPAPRRRSTSSSIACTLAAATSPASRSPPAAPCSRPRWWRGRRSGSPGVWPPTACEAFAEARRRGLEGVIGKDPRAGYRAGERSSAWSKVKVRAEEEFVIGGFTAPRGARQHLGALLVGAWDGAGLRYAGKVGTGFTEATLADLHRKLTRRRRAQPPFVDPPRERDLVWVEPELVAQLGFTERTGDGKLRHPTFLGLREDKAARDVRWSGPRGEVAATPRSGGAAARESASASRRGAARPAPPRRSRRRAPGP